MTTRRATKQVTSRTRTYTEDGTTYKATVNIRHDDRCNNGHNTFSITCDVYRKEGNGRWMEDSFGCQHDLVARLWPDLKPYTKWHLTRTDGPMHYIANTVYHAEKGNLDYALRSAVCDDASLGQLQDKTWLQARLAGLMVEFKAAVEYLGLVY